MAPFASKYYVQYTHMTEFPLNFENELFLTIIIIIYSFL